MSQSCISAPSADDWGKRILFEEPVVDTEFIEFTKENDNNQDSQFSEEELRGSFGREKVASASSDRQRGVSGSSGRPPRLKSTGQKVADM